MRTFLHTLLRFISIGLTGIVLLAAGYFLLDPFKVIRIYPDYSYPVVIPNRDHISTVMYMQNHEKYRYDSFIFGSSRTLAFSPETWKKYLPSKSSPYLFDASSESVYGMWTKLKYLDSTGCQINNVLLVVCRDATFEHSANHRGHLFIHHPATTGESELRYHWTFLKAYFSPKFLIRYYTYRITGNIFYWMNRFLDTRMLRYDPVTNELKIEDEERKATQHPEQYYKEKEVLFYKRPETVRTDSVARIKSEHMTMLKDIRNILIKHKTQYKVVLSPLYDQIRFHPEDLEILNDIFGDHLYDYTGKNEITESYYNYYETAHFRPHAGNLILEQIYSWPELQPANTQP